MHCVLRCLLCVLPHAVQGMVDRGASLSWLSQYSFEEETLFAPLTGVEVLSTRVEGSVLVVEARGYAAAAVPRPVRQPMPSRSRSTA